ncbi:MAG: hypothetical protein M3Q24_01460, partial [bacterium]|nr:hypothetical protein [bacterium]
MIIINLFIPTFYNFPELIPTAHAEVSNVNVWWPTNNATISKTQPFKAVLSGKSVNEYNMFWQVDGGGLVEMYSSMVDYPHKEAIVNVDSWNWNSNGIYAITFIAKDLQNKEISRSSVNVNVLSQTPINTTPIQTKPEPITP